MKMLSKKELTPMDDYDKEKVTAELISEKI
jgi:hypothetical protein